MTANDNFDFDTNVQGGKAENFASSMSPTPAEAVAGDSAGRDEADAVRTSPSLKEAQGSSSTSQLPAGGVKGGDDAVPSEDEPTARIPWYKRTFFRKLGYALTALLIALVIWGAVLMSENPVRVKRVENVRLSIDGVSEVSFRSRNLIIIEDLSVMLPSVAVNVRTTLNDLPRFNNALGDVVTASISLNDIRGPGVYERTISAISSIGTPISVEPATVTITVENLAERNVPVTYSFVNSLPDGYWHGEPSLLLSSLTLRGPESTISRIVKANCVIDLAGRTEDMYESIEPVLLDEQQNVIDASGIVGISGIVAAVTVRMDVESYVDFELQKLLNQVGELNDNYEISSVSINPASIRIAADREILDSLDDALYLEPINVSSLYPGTHTQRVRLMGIPTEASLLNDNSFFVTIEVEDKTAERTFSIPITDVSITGEDRELFNYMYGTRSFAVQLSGPSRIVNALREHDILLILDVSGLMRGTHEITPVLSVEGDPDWLYDGSVEINVRSSFCTVTTAASSDD